MTEENSSSRLGLTVKPALICHRRNPKIALRVSWSSTMVGEIFEFWCPQMAKIALKIFLERDIMNDVPTKFVLEL